MNSWERLLAWINELAEAMENVDALRDKRILCLEKEVARLKAEINSGTMPPTDRSKA